MLAIVRQIANWYSTRHDDYLSPFTRGMRRAAPNKRERILDDSEMRAAWKAAEGAGTFGAIVRLLLLTGQRRDSVTSMRLADLDGDVWHMPVEERAKGVGGDLKLPLVALDIIKAQPRFASSPYVFAGRNGNRSTDFPRARRGLMRRVVSAIGFCTIAGAARAASCRGPV